MWHGLIFEKHDMIPHSWILKTLELVETARNIIELLRRGMQSWRTVLFSGENKLGKVNIKRDIFQEDSLSPLLLVVALISVTIILRTMKQGCSFGKGKERFNNLNDSNDNEIDSLVKVVKIVSGDIETQFEFDKCAVLKMKKKKQGIDLGDGLLIAEADQEGYKYLGILERDDICQEKMKEKVQIQNYKRVRAVLKSKLNDGNVINAIIKWAVTVRYSTGIIN